MACTMAHSGKRVLGLASRCRVSHSRRVSSTTNKKLDINTFSEIEAQQPPSAQQAPKVRLYKSLETVRRRKVNRTYQNSSFIRIRPQETLEDPLQQIISHPSAAIILRDACSCSRCKDNGTSQRDFNVAHIPIDLRPSHVTQDSEGNWTIKWQNDMPGWEDHTSIFTPKQIERLKVYMRSEHRTSLRLWDREEIAREKFSITYDEYMNSEPALAKTLYYLALHGLVFIQKVPEDEHSVERLANRISHLKSTFYGPTWDVRSVPDAKNVAYTSKYLGFHADLLYMKEPPTVQFLHCIHNSATGGESRFVDQFKAIDTLYTQNQDLGSALARTKLRYEYENDGFYFSDIKPIVQFRTDNYQFPRRRLRGAKNHPIGHIYRMFWSPPFLGSIISDFGVSKESLEKSLLAMKEYAAILEREDLVYEEKMEPGTCVMFDNLRVLHARNEFDMNSGKRWLKGTYLDGQDLWSREMKLRGHLAELEQEIPRTFESSKKIK